MTFVLAGNERGDAETRGICQYEGFMPLGNLRISEISRLIRCNRRTVRKYAKASVPPNSKKNAGKHPAKLPVRVICC